jgi:hypothetical protein
MTTLRRLAAATVLAAAAVLTVAGPAQAATVPDVTTVPDVSTSPCPVELSRVLCDVAEDLPMEDTPWG